MRENKLRTKCHQKANKLEIANTGILVAAKQMGDGEEGPEMLTRREKTKIEASGGQRYHRRDTSLQLN